MENLEELSREQLEQLLTELKEQTASVEKLLGVAEEASGGSQTNDNTDGKKGARTLYYTYIIKRVLTALIIAAAVTAIITTYFFPVMKIFGSSMSSTLVDGDVVVMHKTEKLERGDICGFYYGGRILCKRVIGVAGDVIEMDKDGSLFLNGTLLDEPYLKTKLLGECDIEFPYTVPEKSYFVLGDNRRASVDSRNAIIGCVTEDQVAGKLLFCILPFSNFGAIG